MTPAQRYLLDWWNEDWGIANGQPPEWLLELVLTAYSLGGRNARWLLRQVTRLAKR